MLKRILDLLGWLGVALVLAAVALSLLRPDTAALYRGLAIGGLAATLLYLLGQWREIARAFSRRQARYGTLAGASVLVVLAILVAVNYLGVRQSRQWDFTAVGQFTLSDQTRRILEDLDSPVQIRVFARQDEFQRFRDRLDGYERASPHVSVEYIDADRRPAIVRQYDVTTYGTIVFEHGDRVERTTSTGEQELTNTLLRAVRGEQQKVYFVQGHGEKDPASAEREGYNAIAAALRHDNYEIESLVLAQTADVPADAAVVVVAGPQTDYLPGEVELLRAYLSRGGKALVMLDPPEAADRLNLSNLTALLEEWAIEVGNNVVVDVSGLGQILGTDASVPVAATYPSHPITERFGLLTAYPFARSVTPIPGGVASRFAQTVVESSPRSWAETNIRQLMTTGEVALDEAQGDRPGPVSIAAAVSAPAPEAPAAAQQATNGDGTGTPEPSTPETRLVVVGDSDFAANYALGIQGNRDLFLNMVSWLAEHEEMIAIRPREPEDRRITMTAAAERMVFWFSIVIVPGLILLAGVHTWWRRR
jgi:ABC-type uncharacterized transport system involved in gliding motility auxiliary subunit